MDYNKLSKSDPIFLPFLAISEYLKARVKKKPEINSLQLIHCYGAGWSDRPCPIYSLGIYNLIHTDD